METIRFSEKDLKKIEKTLAEAQCILAHFIYEDNADKDSARDVFMKLVKTQILIEDIKEEEAEMPF